MDTLSKAKQNFLKKEVNLSKYAVKSGDAVRLDPEEEDLRSPFFRDIDRILYDLSYTRYQDKTQVFTACSNDHISHRMTHVQLVSKIARTIGRALNLNEDLIEAIALGHDIGHTPLGHSGEAMLNKIAMEELGTTFAHNIQSVRYYMEIANKGKGRNLCIQTLDGILMHNGEILSPIYQKEEKTKDAFLKQYKEGSIDCRRIKKHRPMTLEGCVVRLSDIIGYVGKDIEDAIEIGRLKKEELPKEITAVLGTSNREIVNTLICDVIEQSMEKPYIKMSEDVYNALFALKKFNTEKIYRYSMTKEEYNSYERGMRKLYQKYLKDIEEKHQESIIYSLFLNTKSKAYLENTPSQRKVIDFIAGMTDAFFIKQINHLK